MRILLLLLVLPLAWAQFPAVCNTPENIASKECCPNNCGGSSHGTCVSISSEATWEEHSSANAVCRRAPADVRCNWPLRVFNRVCRCNTGWGGYNCTKCDFGFIMNAAGNQCERRNSNQLFIRRNFMTFTKQERDDYIRILKRAKNEEAKQWAVVVREPDDPDGSFILQDVSVYDMLVVHHFLATREKDNEKCKMEQILESDDSEINFAHAGPTFATWHRYYLLIVEREFHRIADELKISNFAFPYWDWTVSQDQPFTQQLFGEPEYCNLNSPVEVSGALFGNDWPVVCEQTYRSYIKEKRGSGADDCNTVRALCDIESDRRSKKRLERGIISDQHPFLPNDATIRMALAATTYEGNYGFNNRLEGFVDLCVGENNAGCMLFVNDETHNNLHNAVHIYLSGHMRVTPTASNDPIFFLHHGNVDRIFERWLRNFSGPLSYNVTSGEHPGHNRNDYLVPFFPLRTNADMYKISTDLGYMYDSTPWEPPVSDYQICPQPNPQCDRGGTPPLSITGSCFTSPDAGTTNFRVPLHLVLVGACAVLTVFKLLSI